MKHALSYQLLQGFLADGTPEKDALGMEIVISPKFEGTRLLDLNMNNAMRDSSANGREYGLAHGRCERQNHEVLLWPQRVPLECGGLFCRRPSNAKHSESAQIALEGNMRVPG